LVCSSEADLFPGSDWLLSLLCLFGDVQKGEVSGWIDFGTGGVTLGTNVFLQGNPLKKILGNRISPSGFND
jgi:hypothetical protein